MMCVIFVIGCSVWLLVVGCWLLVVYIFLVLLRFKLKQQSNKARRKEEERKEWNMEGSTVRMVK